MMQLQINEKYRITSDAMNIILEKKRIATTCKNSLNMIDKVAKLAQGYVEEKDMEYVHAIYAAAEKLGCVELLKKAVE